MLAIAANELRWSSVAGPLLRRQRPRAWRPHGGLRQDAGDIEQSQRADTGAQVCIAAITRIHQHHTGRKAGLASRIDLLKRDLGLGLEADFLRHASLAPTFAILSPVLRQ